MEIRTMERSRLAEYVRVFLGAFTAPPWNEPWTAEQAAQRLEQFLQPAAAFGLELQEDGEVIAFLLGRYEAYYDGPRFFIEEFCCARRGGGYGSKLLAELEERLEKQGVSRIYLMTIHGEETEGYYRRRGYCTDQDNIYMYKSK